MRLVGGVQVVWEGRDERKSSGTTFCVCEGTFRPLARSLLLPIAASPFSAPSTYFFI